MKQDWNFLDRLEEERPRLVRLCAWFTCDTQAAEDLAQETLLAAWKNQSQLRSPEKLKPWLSAIARSVSIGWARKHHREQFRLAWRSGEEAQGKGPDESLTPAAEASPGPEQEQEQAELAGLLRQALDRLPEQSADLLVEHYLHGRPHAEIARETGLRPGTVAVRLQRARLSLQHMLRAHFQEEALAFELLQREPSAWDETGIWCTNCGQRRLLGQFQRGTADARFILRCPQCHPDPGEIMVGHDLTRPYYAGILGSVKTYKPAYTRLVTGLAPYFRRAASEGSPGCLACGRPAVVQVNIRQIILHCANCDWTSNMGLSGLVIALPEAQRFWRENPRIRALPAQEIEAQGLPAYLTRLQSLSSAAEMVVLTRRDTFASIAVHANISLE